MIFGGMRRIFVLNNLGLLSGILLGLLVGIGTVLGCGHKETLKEGVPWFIPPTSATLIYEQPEGGSPSHSFKSAKVLGPSRNPEYLKVADGPLRGFVKRKRGLISTLRGQVKIQNMGRKIGAPPILSWIRKEDIHSYYNEGARNVLEASEEALWEGGQIVPVFDHFDIDFVESGRCVTFVKVYLPFPNSSEARKIYTPFLANLNLELIFFIDSSAAMRPFGKETIAQFANKLQGLEFFHKKNINFRIVNFSGDRSKVSLVTSEFSSLYDGLNYLKEYSYSKDLSGDEREPLLDAIVSTLSGTESDSELPATDNNIYRFTVSFAAVDVFAGVIGSDVTDWFGQSGLDKVRNLISKKTTHSILVQSSPEPGLKIYKVFESLSGKQEKISVFFYDSKAGEKAADLLFDKVGVFRGYQPNSKQIDNILKKFSAIDSVPLIPKQQASFELLLEEIKEQERSGKEDWVQLPIWLIVNGSDVTWHNSRAPGARRR